MDIQVRHFADAFAARAHARRVVKGKCVGIADERPADTGIEQSELGVDIRICPDGRPRILAGLFLVEDNCHGQILDPADPGPSVLRKILLDEAGKRFIQLASGLGSDCIQAERRLAGTGDTGENGDFLFWQVH